MYLNKKALLNAYLSVPQRGNWGLRKKCRNLLICNILSCTLAHLTHSATRVAHILYFHHHIIELLLKIGEILVHSDILIIGLRVQPCKLKRNHSHYSL